MNRFAVLTLLAMVGTAQAEPKRHEVVSHKEILYCEVPNDPDPSRHRLDVYQPRRKDPCPVLLFFHGGAWMVGGKDDVLGLYGYGTIARRLAERGLVVVMANYRLSPKVRHPEHIKDAARAFAWTCKNITRYGGDPQQIFVGGHSAGGHLAALLATDEKYLKEVGPSRKDILGVIGVSGVYSLDDLDLKLSAADPNGFLHLKTEVRPLAMAFGSDPKVAADASPAAHVQPGLPPFLIINAGWDYAPLRRMGKEFAAALKKNGCDVETRMIPWRTHETLLFDIGRLTIDPVTSGAILGFVERVCEQTRTDKPGK
jgi:acetyl esterase/lipase